MQSTNLGKLWQLPGNSKSNVSCAVLPNFKVSPALRIKLGPFLYWHVFWQPFQLSTLKNSRNSLESRQMGFPVSYFQQRGSCRLLQSVGAHLVHCAAPTLKICGDSPGRGTWVKLGTRLAGHLASPEANFQVSPASRLEVGAVSIRAPCSICAGHSSRAPSLVPGATGARIGRNPSGGRRILPNPAAEQCSFAAAPRRALATCRRRRHSRR